MINPDGQRPSCKPETLPGLGLFSSISIDDVRVEPGLYDRSLRSAELEDEESQRGNMPDPHWQQLKTSISSSIHFVADDMGGHAPIHVFNVAKQESQDRRTMAYARSASCATVPALLLQTNMQAESASEQVSW